MSTSILLTYDQVPGDHTVPRAPVSDLMGSPGEPQSPQVDKPSCPPRGDRGRERQTDGTPGSVFYHLVAWGKLSCLGLDFHIYTMKTMEDIVLTVCVCVCVCVCVLHEIVLMECLDLIPFIRYIVLKPHIGDPLG